MAASSGPQVAVSWTPCVGTLTDDDFLPLGSIEIPFGARETLILQHGQLATSSSCTMQQPDIRLGSSTAGCSISANFLLDTMFGTVLMVPTAASASCTTG